MSLELEELVGDPAYRAGKLLGRQQAVTDVLERMTSSASAESDDRLRAVMEWCLQTLDEGDAEVRLVLRALKEREEGRR